MSNKRLFSNNIRKTVENKNTNAFHITLIYESSLLFCRTWPIFAWYTRLFLKYYICNVRLYCYRIQLSIIFKEWVRKSFYFYYIVLFTRLKFLRRYMTSWYLFNLSSLLVHNITLLFNMIKNTVMLFIKLNYKYYPVCWSF